MKTQKEQTKLVKSAFDKLNGVFYNKSQNYFERLFKQCLDEEKKHRGFGFDFAKCNPQAASPNDCAKMFAVLRVVEYVQPEAKLPNVADYNHTQESCFIAAGIACEFHGEILRALADFDLAELAALDYVNFVSPKD